MRNFIVGTAGHVDHGKTWLIKALTGTDTDRLKEEKRRGITIENGFADMQYGDCNVSIIDVPGHEKFISNMLMGAGGIDMVLLVVGLDEGVMPQTVEHLDILEMLGISRGIIVYTKRDAVDDEEWIDMIKEDVESLVKGTFLEGAPQIEVSAATGLNIEKLRALIVSELEGVKEKNSSRELFRLPADRVFTISGFGTVVTGTLIEGAVETDEDIMVYPECLPARVRSIQVHNKTEKIAFAGQRTAINIGGVKKEELYRGSVLARSGSLFPSRMLDVSLKIFDDSARTVENGSRVHFYCGSTQVIGKVVLLDCDSVGKGGTAFAQIRTETPVAFRRMDRFVIRFYSPVETIGGGVILDASPKKHRRMDNVVIQSLNKRESSDLSEVAELIISEHQTEWLSRHALAYMLRASFADTDSISDKLLKKGRVIETAQKKLIHIDLMNKAKERSDAILNEYHRKNELSGGMPLEEFRSRIEGELQLTDRRDVEDLLRLLSDTGAVRIDGKSVSSPNFKISYSPEMQALKDKILGIYNKVGWEIPTRDEVIEQEKNHTSAAQIIENLAAEGILIKMTPQYFISRKAYEAALGKLRGAIESNGKVTLAEYRDLLGTSRKYAMILLEYFDAKHITRMDGDARVLC